MADCVFNSSCFSTAATEINTSTNKIPLLCGADPGFFQTSQGQGMGEGEGWEWGRVTKVRVMFEYVSEEFEALSVMVIVLSGV